MNAAMITALTSAILTIISAVTVSVVSIRSHGNTSASISGDALKLVRDFLGTQGTVDSKPAQSEVNQS